MYLYVLIILIAGGVIAYRALQDGRFDDPGEDEVIPLPDPRRREASDQQGRVGFGAIRYADPHFDLDMFYARVTEMFLAYHAAAEAGDLKPVRRFVDERYYPELLAALQRPGTSGAGLRVLTARAMTATHESGMDKVRVMISAARGAEEESSVHEYWTLIRRQGAITKADLSLYKCPNCGAPTDGDDPTRCGYCGARLADPALDWVVARIRVE